MALNAEQLLAIEAANEATARVDLPTYSELRLLLARASNHVNDSFRDMLCKADGYSEHALKRVMETPEWKRVEGDRNDTRAALERLKP